MDVHIAYSSLPSTQRNVHLAYTSLISTRRDVHIAYSSLTSTQRNVHMAYNSVKFKGPGPGLTPLTPQIFLILVRGVFYSGFPRVEGGGVINQVGGLSFLLC